MIAGFRCAVCGATRDIAEPFAWRCINATADDPHHVLQLIGSNDDTLASDNPFIRYGPRLAWWAFARSNGLTAAACEALTWEVAGDFRMTPCGRSEMISAAVGTDAWVKDETGNVAGSHKARHLASILLHLRAAETLGLLDRRPPLAIASCGNAALAAATLAAASDWPIDVYVPMWMEDAFGHRLDALGARIHRCERSADDPPGDPAMLRFREAVAAGAIPFSVQGPENAYCLDGGRTIGWELADQLADDGVVAAAVYVQIGGGALAACTAGPASLPLVAVQTEGCAPLAAALERADEYAEPAQHWADVMQPWPDPASAADGILDDETYDWIAIRDHLHQIGGRTVVTPESAVAAAHDLAGQAGFGASHTGTAGLAGLLADDQRPDGPVVIVMSGVQR